MIGASNKSVQATAAARFRFLALVVLHTFFLSATVAPSGCA